MQDEQFAWLGRFSPMILQDARPPTRKMSASSLEAAGPLDHWAMDAMELPPVMTSRID